jgi:hypothetical protein
MRSTFWKVLAVSLFIGLWTWGGAPFSFDASAALNQDSEDTSRRGKAEVVIIICQIVGTGTPIGSAPYIMTVQGVSHSGGGPAVQVGVGCGQALASVLSAGFRLRDVEAQSITGLIYTLIDR